MEEWYFSGYRGIHEIEKNRLGRRRTFSHVFSAELFTVSFHTKFI